MLNITLITVGKIKEKYFTDAVNEYLKIGLSLSAGVMAGVYTYATGEITNKVAYQLF